MSQNLRISAAATVIISALVSTFLLTSVAEAASCSIWSENVSGGSATLRWSATSDAVSAHIDGIGAVNLSGVQYLSGLTSDRTYTMRVYDTTGEPKTCQTTIIVVGGGSGSQRPSCSITFTPNYNVNPYSYSCTLSWSTWNATSASISPNVGSVGLNGSQAVYASGQIVPVYTMTVQGPGGSNTCSTSSYTYPQPPYDGDLRCSIASYPASIQNGAAASLVWTSFGASRAWLSDGTGTVALNGTLAVRPESSRVYTLFVSDSTGRVKQCETTVTVAGSQLPLSRIPYTGDFGPLGTAISWLLVTLGAALGAKLLVPRVARLGQ